MALGVRGSNPVWLLDDLEANLFDDTFYMFVLENTIPYIPAVVYHDPDLNIAWTNPIRFLANGTLPVDIFFQSDVVYRLEFRQGPTQSDPLIYEVNNYVAGAGGSTPVDTVAFASSNQIANPQFALVDFASPFALTNVTDPAPVEVGPGWFLELTGTGSATLNQVPLNASTPNPSNAPYALRLTLVGWTTVLLRQRFQQNGMLWANKIVSTAITARLQGAPQSINAILVDSNNTTLAEVLFPSVVNQAFNEFTGHGTLPASSNPDVPPAAYIDYRLNLPTSADIYISSIQMVVQELPFEPTFEQDSIDRQIDHTFHTYRDSLLQQPKESLLTGWDFGLNPWQFSDPTQATLASQCAYTADQTIIYQQTGASQVSVGQASVANNYAFQVTAVTATNRFAMIQYIDPATLRDVWGYKLSSLVRAAISSPTHSSTCRFKMRLIYRSSLPSTIGAAEPISTWTGINDPTFSAGWTAIVPKNDPVYTFGDGSLPFVFEGLQLPAADSADMTLGIVLYTVDNLVETATADSILFKRISLCRNDFAIDGQILTLDETLQRCQFYYESSFNLSGVPGVTPPTQASSLLREQRWFFSGGSLHFRAGSFGFEFNTIKRSENPVMNLYSVADSNAAGLVRAYLLNAGSVAAESNMATTNFSSAIVGNRTAHYLSVNNSDILSVGVASDAPQAYILFHFSADARLGV